MNKFISARAVLSHLLWSRPSFVRESREGTLALCIYCACAYECLAAPSRPSPVSRLFHAGCTSS